MRVVLVGPELEENLSVRYLAAALIRAGHECSIVPFNAGKDTRRVARSVMRRRPGLVGLSLVAQRRYPEYRELAALLRHRGFAGHITAGGHFASLRAAEILRDTPPIDSIIHHDGEERIVALANAVDAGGGRIAAAFAAASGGGHEGLDGISWRMPDGPIGHRPPERVADVDTLAPPLRRRPHKVLGLRCAPIVSSRGCAGSCSFCSIHAWHRQVRGARLRFRSPAAVAREMIEMHREHGVRVFTFHDDDFLHPDPAKARERARAILETAEDGIGSPFAFNVKCRPDQVDEGLFAYLQSKGLVRAYVGVETASALGIRTLNRRVQPGDNERALGVFRSLGILACFNLLVFHPETTLEELEENADFLSRYLDHPFDVGRTELYAHAALETRMVAEKRAIGDWRGYDYRIADARAQEAFSLFVAALWDRHFGAHSIPHRAQDLSFRMNVLRRFSPRLASAELDSRVNALVREVNASTVDHLRRIAACARAGSSSLPASERAALVESIRSEVDSRLRGQSIQWAALSLELECRARIARAFPGVKPAFAHAPRLVSRAAIAVPLIALAFCSCSEETGVEDPLPPPHAKFGTDIEPYLNATCSAAGCHSALNPAGGLTLTTGYSYDDLVNKPSTELPAMRRVKPGEDDSSYVVYKLEGTQLTVGGTGDKMPPGGQVSQTFLNKLRNWIGYGAHQD